MLNIYSIRQKIIEFLMSFRKGIVTVYMFHEISDKPLLDDFYNVHPNIFVSFINSIDKEKIISTEKIKEPTINSIIITFDDGFESTYINAFPVLIKHNIPFTVFISPKFIGQKGYMTKQQLILLSNQKLCTIGHHSYSHPILRNFSKREKIYEIASSKKILESMINKKVKVFAYPYGSIFAVSSEDIKIAKKSDYECAFSTIKGTITKKDLKNDRLFFLPRVNISKKI
jgi:peptidoglycan/xylan/chitin deacetylase (PgdA/CDA1 family)